MNANQLHDAGLMVDPSDIIVELLGKPTKPSPVDPAITDFLCPHVDRRCPKRSTANKTEPYPVCSLYKIGRSKNLDTTKPICVCPKRFYEADFLKDVVTHCWPGTPPAKPLIANEVKMKGFGNVDFVIADEAGGKIRQFLSVELQAIDITGSARDAYQALRAGKQLQKRPTYNFNWDNVYKRYITQLIRKGYFHHHWGTKIVAVIQDEVYNYICEKFHFMRQSNVQDPTVNIIFMSYKFDPVDPAKNKYKLVFDKVEGTSHSNLQQAVIYAQAPSKDDFHSRIREALKRS
jgi:hypothetical protein